MNKRVQQVIVFRHDTFETAEVYCVKRWAKVNIEGGAEHFFDSNTVSATETGDTIESELIVEIDPSVLHAGNRAEDIALVRAQGLMVDDDNDPAPENIPDLNAPEADTPNGQWGWDGQCHRIITGVNNVRPKINNLNGDILKTIGHCQP